MATSYTPTVHTVDISDWTPEERMGIDAPYALDGAPYGESIPTRWFPTLEAAMAEAVALVSAVEGTTYSTSWGTQLAWVEGIRVTHYTATPATWDSTACALCHGAYSAAQHDATDAHCELCGVICPALAGNPDAPFCGPTCARIGIDSAARVDDWEREIAGAPYPGTLYSPEDEPLRPHYGTPFGRPTSHPTRALTASMAPMLPVSALDASLNTPRAQRVSAIIADWLTDPVYAGVTRTPEGFARTAFGEELTGYARTSH